MLTVLQGAVIAFLAMQLGILLETFCPGRGSSRYDYSTPEPRRDSLCRQNAFVLKWFGGTALCVLVTYSTFSFVRGKM